MRDRRGAMLVDQMAAGEPLQAEGFVERVRAVVRDRMGEDPP
jgi:hypothetical protein